MGWCWNKSVSKITFEIDRAIFDQVIIALPLLSALCSGVASVLDARNLRDGTSVYALLLIQFSTTFFVVLSYTMVARPDLPAVGHTGTWVLPAITILSIMQKFLEAIRWAPRRNAKKAPRITRGAKVQGLSISSRNSRGVMI